MSKRYAGVFNYMQDKLPMTNMIAFEHIIEEAECIIREHANMFKKNVSKDYHIAVYECENWGDQDGNDIPTKIETIYL